MRRGDTQSGLPALLVLLALTVGGGCGGDGGSTPPGPLPPDPADWVCADTPPSPADLAQWCADHPDRGQPADLPVPPPLDQLAAKNAFDVDVLQEFLRTREYVALGWQHDVTWRFTGPYVGTIGSGSNYGTHPAVRLHYSPEVIDWLCNGREGGLPDGAIIVKEMASIRPCLNVSVDADGCMQINSDPSPSSWTVMIRAQAASHDGWYWGSISTAPPDPPPSEWQKGNPPVFNRSAITSDDFFAGSGDPPSAPNPLWSPTGYVYSDPLQRPSIVPLFNDHGADCVNCHASAEQHSTFSSLDNLLTPGLRYKGFDFAPGTCSPTDAASSADPPQGIAAQTAPRAYQNPFTPPLAAPPADFQRFFGQIQPIDFAQAWERRMPAETYDHVVSPPSGKALFITSDQCSPCHDASFLTAAPVNMVVEHEAPDGTQHLLNLSPYGEWKASPMGLAGRDPIFFAQLQGETNLLPSLRDCIEDTCLHCHGVMGQREFAADTAGQGDDRCKALYGIAPPAGVPFGAPFRRAALEQWPGAEPSDQQHYAALARDGISCAVCHHIASQDLGEERTYTGNFLTGAADEIYGPYATDDVKPKSMQNALGITPKHGAQMVGVDVCGTCHNILLPVFDNGGQLIDYRYEQSTQLEWSNSEFATGRQHFTPCQGCHMRGDFNGTPLRTRIANIEDDTVAPTTFRLPDADLALKVRDDYARHSLHGLNAFLNQMFQQFPLLLGYRQIDALTGTFNDPPLITGAQSIYDMAAEETARVAITSARRRRDGALEAQVEVTNQAGHYLPSGVGFRRMFLELLVLDADDNILWASGRTNALGFILDGRSDRVLVSEDAVPAGSPPCAAPQVPFQPHYQVIEREDQVQIYQEVVRDSDQKVTSSFLRRVEVVKDNRIRPRGFDPATFAASDSPYIRDLAENPGETQFDPHYTNPKLTGSDQVRYVARLDADVLARAVRVQATLYSQSIPPGYLQQRFNAAGCGAAEADDIEQLHYMASHLNVAGATDEHGAQPLRDWKLKLAAARRGL